MCNVSMSRIESGLGELWVQVAPGVRAVEAGHLHHHRHVLLTSLSCSSSRHLVLHSWSPTSSAPPSPPLTALSSYSTAAPLGHPASPLLCPWSLLLPLWPATHLPHLATLPRELDYSRVRGLATLDTASAPAPTLVVRLLAASRLRLVPQQDNRFKPWMAMKNLLVADRTAYTVVTLWDEAVRETVGAFREGDILVLEGRYKVTQHRDPVKDRLAPKLRQLAVSPTQAEVKVNQGDLARVRVVGCGATANLPEPLWRFVTCRQLEQEGRMVDTLVDVVGVVVHHGRWERQACQRRVDWARADSETFPTGQYWARTWLEVADHTSPATVPVKVYLDTEQRAMVAAALPATTVILTNLLYKPDSKGGFSHLEWSTESQAFAGAAAMDARFAEAGQVEVWREATEEQEEAMRCRLEQEGSFGGHRLLEEVVEGSGGNKLEVLGTREEVMKCLGTVAWRATARARVRGRLVLGVEEQGEHLLPTSPPWGSLVRRVEGMGAGVVAREVEEYCQFTDLPTSTGGGVEEGEVALATLVMMDCSLVVQLGRVAREEVEGFEVVLCLDLYRLTPGEEGEGVEAVIKAMEVVERKRKVGEAEGEDEVESKRQKEDVVEEEEDSNESDWSVHTQDLIDFLK